MDKKQYYREYYLKNRERLIKKNIENTRKRKENIEKGHYNTFKITHTPITITFD